MSQKKVSLGLDFSTESARALLVDIQTGDEIASVAANYKYGVIERKLPSGVALEPETALQNPMDYLAVIEEIVPAVMQKSGVKASEIIGIGSDFTASTVLPVLADGTPLCTLSEFKDEPFAWV